MKLASTSKALRATIVPRQFATFRCDGDETRLRSFLSWLRARDVRKIDVTVHARLWSAIAPEYLSEKTFAVVRIFPAKIFEIAMPVWIPGAEEVVSGFVDGSADPKCAAVTFDAGGLILYSSGTLIAPHVRVPRGMHVRCRAATVTRLDRVSPDTPICIMCEVITDDMLKDLAAFTDTVHLESFASGIKPAATIPQTFLARALHVRPYMLELIEAAPRCEVLSVDISDSDGLKFDFAAFPMLKVVTFGGYTRNMEPFRTQFSNNDVCIRDHTISM